MPCFCLVNINRHKIKASCIHFLDNAHISQRILFLFRKGIRTLFIICQIIFQLISSLTHDLIGKSAGADTEKGCIICQRVENLTVGNTPRHHNVGRSMGFREHVFDLLTGPYVPVRHAMSLHILFPFRF